MKISQDYRECQIKKYHKIRKIKNSIIIEKRGNKRIKIKAQA